MLGTYQDVVDLLAKNGVEIGDDAAIAAKDKFGSFVFVASDAVLGEGQVSVDEKTVTDLRNESIKWKNRCRKAESKMTELQEAIDAGDSTNKKMLANFKAENERMKPIVEKFITDKRTAWESAREKIPEALRSYYRFPAEGEELDDETMIRNVDKLNEHVAIGAFELNIGDDRDVKIARKPATGKKTKTADPEWKDKTAAGKMANGYKTVDKRIGDETKTEDTEE